MPLSDDGHPSRYAYVGEDDSDYFRLVHGRNINTLNSVYLLPVDQDEVKRSELHHRLLQFVFKGHNYIGPVREALQFGQQRRVLDLGTGGGFWAIAMADEFPRAEVIGVDLAPIQPRMVPSNCTFELCDLDQLPIPYPDNHFDLIHARSMHTGIRDYPRFLKEIARLLRPGGLVLLIEPNLHPIFSTASAPVAAPACPNPSTPSSPSAPASHPQLLAASMSSSAATSQGNINGNFDFSVPQSAPASTFAAIPSATFEISAGSSASGFRTGNGIAPVANSPFSTPTSPGPSLSSLNPSTSEQRGWITLWETYRTCLRLQNIDITVPERLSELLSATGQFEKIVVQDGNIPVGFWPKDEILLTVGQLQWMDYELFLPALKPLFLSRGLPPSQVDRIIKDAQRDLYYPSTCQSSHLHIVYASKHFW